MKERKKERREEEKRKERRQTIGCHFKIVWAIIVKVLSLFWDVDVCLLVQRLVLVVVRVLFFFSITSTTNINNIKSGQKG